MVIWIEGGGICAGGRGVLTLDSGVSDLRHGVGQDRAGGMRAKCK